MTEPALFEMEPLPDAAPRADESVDQRRNRRQSEAIANGVHPLALVWPGIRLHLAADRDAQPGDGVKILRCGSCRWREVLRHNDRLYPKCTNLHGARSTPVVTHGAATDCRAWWPACSEYVHGGAS